MLYGPDGCIGDVHWADSVAQSLRQIAQELKRANDLKEKEMKEAEDDKPLYPNEDLY